MFRTGHDAANRETVKRCRPGEMNVVGLALRDDKKLVDRITKGAACIRSRTPGVSPPLTAPARVSGPCENCARLPRRLRPLAHHRDKSEKEDER